MSPAARDDGTAREPRTARQWVVLGVAALLLAALCLVAGRWQWNRYEAREAQIDLIEANWSAPAVSVAEVLPGPSAVVPAGAVWQPVVLTGRYVPDATVLLRNRPVNGTPGYHVLVPFDTGSIVLVVDRGFVPMGADGSAPDSVPAPPAGEVSVVASLRADEPASSRGAPAGQVQAISTEQVLAAASATGRVDAGWADGHTVGAYGALRSETPAPETGLATLPAPDTDPGSHLSYAFQWCVFALGAVAGYILLWRRERGALRGQNLSAGDLLLAAPDLDAAAGGAGTRARRAERQRRASAEDEEDALIETQLR
ncbi:SURF1 family protein [Antribacter sp. KLBMP9083]|uniref:SURF1-like protein n=1 Tax=Antribacter soli TaxID=2910976 RepID=A0AA41U9C8_9MICO|nr:SURF1 family protein [Antribacter soli]MCF4121472.1 SURF1 family protein [Antribacter soli]